MWEDTRKVESNSTGIGWVNRQSTANSDRVASIGTDDSSADRQIAKVAKVLHI